MKDEDIKQQETFVQRIRIAGIECEELKFYNNLKNTSLHTGIPVDELLKSVEQALNGELTPDL